MLFEAKLPPKLPLKAVLAGQVRVLLAPHVAQETMQKRRLVYLKKTSPLQRIVDEINRLLA